MVLFGFFRRKPPIHDAKALAAFIDAQSAFLVQKGIYDYTQARAGHYTKVLLKEQDFIDAFERSRWQAYPLGLAMIGEMVEGVLYPHAGDRRAFFEAFQAFILSVFDRYPVPPLLESGKWQEARGELVRKLGQMGMHPPKEVVDIPVPYAQRYFDLMPFHKDLLTQDMPTARSYLQINLINIRDELLKRMDAPAVVQALRAGAA
jgi:hypothetical protein